MIICFVFFFGGCKLTEFIDSEFIEFYLRRQFMLWHWTIEIDEKLYKFRNKNLAIKI